MPPRIRIVIASKQPFFAKGNKTLENTQNKKNIHFLMSTITIRQDTDASESTGLRESMFIT